MLLECICKLHCPSLGADSVGHPLSAKELLVLKDYILPEDVIESLQKEGLDLNTIAFVQTTIEEVQRQLDSLGQSELASSLRQRLDFGKHLNLVNFITSHTYNEEEKLVTARLKQTSAKDSNPGPYMLFAVLSHGEELGLPNHPKPFSYAGSRVFNPFYAMDLV